MNIPRSSNVRNRYRPADVLRVQKRRKEILLQRSGEVREQYRIPGTLPEDVEDGMNHNRIIQLSFAILFCIIAISVFFNIVHSPADIISRTAHAVAPIALCGSLEMLMLQLRRDLRRAGDLPEQDTQTNDDKRLKVLAWFTENPESTIDQARKALGMGWGTVRDIRTDLVSAGLIQDRPQ